MSHVEIANTHTHTHLGLSSFDSFCLPHSCPAQCDPHVSEAPTPAAQRAKATAEFLEWAMHGSLEHVRCVILFVWSRLPPNHDAFTLSLSLTLSPSLLLMAHCSKFAKDADVHAREATSGRTALHKAAFWGHHHLVSVLLRDYKICPNVQDLDGDTALHDACRFGHVKVVEHLLAGGADSALKNNKGQTALDVALLFGAPKFGIEKQWFDTIVRKLRTPKL